MLLVDRVELARRFRGLAGVQIGETLIVEHFRWIGLSAQLGDIDVGIVLAGGHQHTGRGSHKRNGNNTCHLLQFKLACNYHS